MSSFFVREIERRDESVLRIHQMESGDVGVVVWDAALVLLHYMDKENERQKGAFLRGRTIVELGAGTGVVSVAAATHGAFVVASDLRRHVDLMVKNKEENFSVIEGGGGKLECLAVDWTEELSRELTRTLRIWSDGDSSSASVPPSTRSSEETASSSGILPVTFPDMLIVCDCAYYESSVVALVKTMTSLAGPKTLVFFVFEERPTPDKIRVTKKFFEAASSSFEIARVGFDDMDETFRSQDIHILMMKRK